MTRETKIGLLVGLAFIIVIGILLSDHINSSTELSAAPMGKTFDAVENSVDSPASKQTASAVVVTAPPVVPQTSVPTQHDQPQSPNGMTIVTVGPGGDPSQVPLPRPTSRQPAVAQPSPEDIAIAQGQQQPPAENANNSVGNNDEGVSDPSAGKTREDSNVPDQLRRLAKANGMDLVPAGSSRTNSAAPKTPVGVHSENAANATAGLRQVKAEEGDTVSKMAGKYLGANNKANRQAIINANPSMGPDGHIVIAGRTYQIPAAGTIPPKTVSAAPIEPTPHPVRQPAAQQPIVQTPPGVKWYTVKENDSLWKIASEQLGSGARWSEIRDLNADVLKGSEAVHVNMRLKLPPKGDAE
ncbi:MAG TPA: LysM peptidoglycan-binding domain-containing protein [Tepidisphaeraceae bacterium]|nr:LysM peptidoglycan-binding domain-containing protein [Tepidisphaeraceae bacterium]